MARKNWNMRLTQTTFHERFRVPYRPIIAQAQPRASIATPRIRPRKRDGKAKMKDVRNMMENIHTDQRMLLLNSLSGRGR